MELPKIFSFRETKKPIIKRQYKTFGGQKVLVNNEDKGFVPSGQKIIGSKEYLKTLAYAINNSFPVLMVGETGVGKTSLARFLAQETKNSYRRVNLNGQTTTDDFVGKMLLSRKGTYWQDGVLIEAMREGRWLVLDEINAAPAEILFVLHSLLDDDGYVVLPEKDGEIVKPHPDFRLFATMNPATYQGVRELNKAFMSRFPVILNVSYPDAEDEEKILAHYAKKADPKVIRNLVKMAKDLRKTYKKEELEYVCSTRDIINCAVLSQDLSLKEALEYSVLNKVNKDDIKAVETVASLYFGKELIEVQDLSNKEQMNNVIAKIQLILFRDISEPLASKLLGAIVSEISKLK